MYIRLYSFENGLVVDDILINSFIKYVSISYHQTEKLHRINSVL